MSIPFFEPYVSPDGTPRRALVERVPECRPEALKYRWAYGPDAATCHSVASDLCSMACIRWIRLHHQGWLRTMRIGDGVCWDLENGRNGWHKDDATTLNRIAHAVADELGVER